MSSSFYLFFNLALKSNLVLAQNNRAAICLFDRKTSSVSKKEINKLIGAADFLTVRWSKELRENIDEADYLVLSKGGLGRVEQDIIIRFLKNGGGLILFLPKHYDEGFLKKVGLRTYDIYGGNLAV